MSENIEDFIKNVENVRVGLGDELAGKLLDDLKRSGHVAEEMEIDDFLENYSGYPVQEAEYLIKKGMERVAKRKGLGMHNVYCHASPKKKDEDFIGDTYFSTIDSIYLGGGEKPINYIYIVSPKGNFRDDERAPANAKGRWFLGHDGAKILEQYSMNDIDKFIEKYPEAEFISYEGDDKLRDKYPGMKFI